MEPRMAAHRKDGDNEEGKHRDPVHDALEGVALEGEDDGDEEENVVGADDFELMFKRFAQESIPVRVSEVTVEGNSKTCSSVIQSHLEPLKKAETTRQLLREAAHAVNRIESLGLFEKCILSLESGPVQGSVNVVLHVQEEKMPCCFALAAFSQTKEQKAALGGSVKWKNMLGYGETWDGAGSYGWDGDHELSAGLYLPRFRRVPNALVTRVAVSTPEWLKLASYRVRIAGVSVGLFSDNYQDLSYNLTWQDDDSPDGPGLLPSLKYSFKIDERDSVSRPTRGYAFRFATQFLGEGSDVSKHSAHQDIDLRFAIPLGSHHAALNIGLSGGFMLPLAKDYFRKSISSIDRFSVGRHSSLVCEMNGPTTILGLISRGVNSTKPSQGEDGAKTSDSRDHFGGGLAVTGFADLSFDFPWGPLRRQNMYGHCFAFAGNLVDLSETGRGSGHFQSFLSSFKCFIGAGVVIPTRFFRLEVNFCQMLGHHLNNESKRGIQVGFSSPC
eukprot:c19948_g1_i1 orf=164-1660(+)